MGSGLHFHHIVTVKENLWTGGIPDLHRTDYWLRYISTIILGRIRHLVKPHLGQVDIAFDQDLISDITVQAVNRLCTNLLVTITQLQNHLLVPVQVHQWGSVVLNAYCSNHLNGSVSVRIGDIVCQLVKTHF